MYRCKPSRGSGAGLRLMPPALMAAATLVWPAAVMVMVLPLAGGFSLGAPESACQADMRPRHGFDPQVRL